MSDSNLIVLQANWVSVIKLGEVSLYWLLANAALDLMDAAGDSDALV